MKIRFKDIKLNIIFLTLVMMLLFIICVIKYGNIKPKNSQENHLATYLESLIPFTKSSSPKYLTAYQSNNTKINDIHNDILLTKALEFNNYNLELKKENVSSSLIKAYGENIFIAYNSFNGAGEYDCKYNEEKEMYKCLKNKSSDIIYDAKRLIKNLEVKDNLILTEQIIFYSQENINDVDYYKIYSDGTYQKVIAAFTSVDVNKANSSLDGYLKRYYNYYVTYKSFFKVQGNDYVWLETQK